MAQLGRISGPLLTENLLRNGSNLAFSNDRTNNSTIILYLDVNNNRIGINNDIPVRDLDVSGTSSAFNLLASNGATFSNLEFTAGQIENLSDSIFIQAPNQVNVPALQTDSIEINDNVIATYAVNSDLQLVANASGAIVFGNNTETNGLTLLGTPTFNQVIVDGDLSVNNDVRQVGDITVSKKIINDFLIIEGNYIEATSGNIQLDASGTGKVTFTDLEVTQNFTVSGPTSLNNLIAEDTSTPNLTVGNDLTVSGNLVLDEIDIIQNTISVRSGNTNLNLTPAGTGSVEFLASTNVSGNIHATGNITMDGDFVAGDENTDSITLNAEINSDIVPNFNNTYNLGSPTTQWSSFESALLNGQEITTGAIGVGGVNVTSPQGNIFYVAVNGDDTNLGDHQQGPFRTIKHALSVADASTGGPVTIYIYPGEYEEELPLVVPSNTTVKGLDLRNCIVKPDTSSQSEDVFLLTGETTVEDLTIKDFYYDSINDKGYAFRYASGAITTTRSPYIRNITVITQGSSTSATDPRGFASGDAGKGALVDGTDVDNLSTDAAMLFHSCTFITPGVDALSMTGGVRVEWLNCFTYFANRGLYAFNDPIGRINQDGSTVNKGAELRSIGSASVYGNIGAEADGNETLMYLINHNFAYIGAGKDVSNDATLVIQANETVELNSGRIYYTSQDAGGNFRVGDAFIVDFERGTTSLSSSDVALTGISSITVNTGGDETFINAEKIETGNWRFEDNTISALIGDGNLTAASGTINFTNNVNMQSNLSMTGNFTMSGANFTLGNAAGDNVSFEADVASDIIPQFNNISNLGTSVKKWNNTFVDYIPIDGIEIRDNYIRTVESNADLELRANSVGNILFTSDVEVDNNLNVNGTVNLADTVITTLSHTGNLNHTGDKIQTGNKTISGELDVTGTASFESISIETNFITSNVSNADLELRASGTGQVIIPSNTVEIENSLTLEHNANLSDVTVTASVALEELAVDDLLLSDNRIQTTTADTDLLLAANNIGKLLIPSNNVEIDNVVNINGISNFANTGINGNVNLLGNYDITGNIIQSGATSVLGNLTVAAEARFEDIMIKGNVLSSISSNADLELRANASGVVRFIDDTIIQNNLQVNGTVTASDVNVATSLDLNELVINSNLEINDNYVTTTVSNSDLELRATGDISVQDNFVVDNNLTVNGTTNILNTNIIGDFTRIGNTVQQGNAFVTGSYSVTGNIDVGARGVFEDILVSGNTVKTTLSNSDLELRASGTGVVRFNTDTLIDNNLTIQGDITAGNISINTSLGLNQIVTPSNILIDDNFITTTETNSNLELRADGLGQVVFQDILLKNNTITTLVSNIILNPNTNNYVDISTDKAVIVPIGTTAERSSLAGDIRYNNQFNLFEGTASANVVFNGVYSDDYLTRVKVNNDDILRFDVNNTEVATIDSGLNILQLQNDDININANSILTNVSNSDLEFIANGTGNVTLANLGFGTNTITDTSGTNLTLASSPNGYYKIGGTFGIAVTIGDTASRRTGPVEGEFRYNTDETTAEVFDGIDWISAAGPLGETVSEETMAEILDEFILIFG